MQYFFVFCSSHSFGQYIPKEEKVALADSLHKVFDDKEDEQVIALSSEIVYTFNRDANGAVYASEKRTDHLISVLDESVFQFYRSQDNYSEIIGVSALTGKKQKSRKPLSSECISNFSESIFDSDLEVCSYEYKFTRKGEEVKIVSQKRYTDLNYLTNVDLYERFPILERKVIFKVPSWLEIDIHELNTAGHNFKKEVNEAGSITEYVFSIGQVEGFRDLDHSPGFTWFAPEVVPVFKTYDKPNGQKVTLFSSIDDQYKWYKSLVDEVDNKTATFEAKVQALIKDKKTDQEKISAIFYWVQDNIRYIAFERGVMGFRPEPAYKVYSKRFGDCKGMSNLTKEMLKLAGYDARLCWIGTNSISDDYNYQFPSLANDNHMICMVMLNDQPYFLDATENYVAFGDCASRIQGRKTMVENGNGFDLMTVPSETSIENSKKFKTRIQIKGDILLGSSEYIYTGEEKRFLLQGYSYIEKQREKSRNCELFIR